MPRIAREASTFNGLLRYDAVPGRTIFNLAISNGAKEKGSLYYTFGTGTEERACAFLPYWKAFMSDLRLAFLNSSP